MHPRTLVFRLHQGLKREKNILAGFKNAFSLLEGEIGFIKNTPQKAFGHISGIASKPLNSFFIHLSKTLENQRISFEQAWKKAIDNAMPKRCLTDSDMQILKEFSARFGKSDIENEIKNIHNTYLALCVQLDEAKNICDSSKKIYQSAGVLGGVLIAVILF